MSSHDTQNGRQSQAPSGELRREERIEYLLESAAVHTRARVLDFQVDEAARFELRSEQGVPQVGSVALGLARANSHHARPVTEGLRSVRHQVHGDLRQLGHIA